MFSRATALIGELCGRVLSSVMVKIFSRSPSLPARPDPPCRCANGEAWSPSGGLALGGPALRSDASPRRNPFWSVPTLVAQAAPVMLMLPRCCVCFSGEILGF